MKKIFLLDNDLMGFFPKTVMNNEFFNIYDKNRFKKLLRRIFNKLGITSYLFLFNRKWVKKVKDTDIIIIFDGSSINKIVESILKKFPNKRIAVWYWNPVSNAALRPSQLDERIDSIWTYDPFDAKKYNLNLNSQFYFKELIPNKGNLQEERRDVFFVGADKNREEELAALGQIFTQKRISFYFHLTKLWNSKKKSDKYASPLDYSTVINYILGSRVVLDLVGNKKQEGISLRPLEALFFKKKLITNNVFIKDKKIYSSKNVFIIGIDDFNKLRKFIKEDYIEEKNYNSLINYYDFKEWSKRFENKIQ